MIQVNDIITAKQLYHILEAYGMEDEKLFFTLIGDRTDIRLGTNNVVKLVPGLRGVAVMCSVWEGPEEPKHPTNSHDGNLLSVKYIPD